MVKFVLLAHPRSGSNLVASCLFKHDHVHMFGELFNEVEAERKRAYSASFNDCHTAATASSPIRINENDFYREEEDGEEFLKRAVFYKHETQQIAVGFKIFFNQARANHNSRKAWQYLLCNKDIKVIHLTRDNLIESWLSLKLAFQTGQWVFDPANPNPEPPPPLHLLPGELKGYLRETLAGQRWARMKFRKHHVLEIEYKSDLCTRFEETMLSVQRFLEVPTSPPKQRLRKQAQRKTSEQISNYQELKTHFAPTRFSRWFE